MSSYYGPGGEDRGRDYQQNRNSPRDRSRSRDYNNNGASSRVNRDGYNNRGGGGWGGGGGGRGQFMENRATEIMVRTNHIPLNVIDRGAVEENEWVHYNVTILAAYREKKKDAAGNIITPFEFQVLPKGTCEGDKELNLEKGSNPLSRRILSELCKQEHENDSSFFFVSDGSNTAFAPRRLFTESFVPFQRPKKTDKTERGTYGPADSPPSVEESKAPEGNLVKFFDIKVKEDCETSHPDSDRSRNAWFYVRFEEVGFIQGSHIQQLNDQMHRDDIVRGERIRQAIDIVLKTAFRGVGMMSYGRSPRAFYFPEEKQLNILGSKLKQMFRSDGATYAPFLGLANSTKICENGQFFINSDVVVNYFDRDCFYPAQNRVRIPLLSHDRRNPHILKIMDIQINNPHFPITDKRVQDRIYNEIKKIKFYVMYKRIPSPEYVKKMRERGIFENQIERNSTIIMQNLSMRIDQKKGVSIIWCADDPAEYSFEVQPRKKRENGNQEEDPSGEVQRYTVADYYKSKYGITLKYPKMPIIYVGRKGWFPIEFLYQSFGKKFDANSPEHVNGILSHFDENAGTDCVNKIMELQHSAMSMSSLGLSFSHVLKLFNLEASADTPSLKAKILPFPKLSFEHNVNIMNGSWNLRDVRFYRPADLNSFAVIFFGHEHQRDVTKQFVREQLNASRRHGINLPRGVDISMTLLDSLVVQAESTNPHDVYTAFSEAIKRAQQTFLYDELNQFNRPGSFFRTYVQNPDGLVSECLIIPPPRRDMKEFGIIFRQDVFEPTHNITLSGKNLQARMMFEMKCSNNTVLVDPFDIMVENEYLIYHRDDWRHAQFLSVKYRLINEDTIVDANEASDSFPSHIVALHQVECPAMIFCCFPKADTEVYSFVKCMSHFKFGVQSQCVSLDKFNNQKNKNQFCSNIALKLNTKLMNKCNGARAWSTTFKHASVDHQIPEIPWVSEVLTLVIGIGFSHGFGQNANSVVAGTVCLDDGCMQFAQDYRIVTKCELIPKSVLKDLIKCLIHHFLLHRDDWPSRVLIFRDGLSDGSFDRVRMHEIPHIRKAFYEIFSDKMRENGDWQCENHAECQDKGCIFCTPLITYVACQNQHNVRIAPEVPLWNGKRTDKNVPSGTCLDHTIIDFKDSLRISTESVPRGEMTPNNLILISDSKSCTGFDFFLTPQGGLKGTSKPVYYRTLYNENAVWKPMNGNSTPLDKDKLENLVYHMSFQYGSATKATRNIPIIHYSKKLATMVTGYLLYLSRGQDERTGQSGELIKIDLEDVEDDERQYLRRKRDGSLIERKQMVRQDMATLPSDVPSEMKTMLMTNFSPFKVDDNQVSRQSPFRVHPSA